MALGFRMKTAPTILTLLLLFRALHADSAEFVIDPNDILPKFDEPYWTAVEYSAIPKRTEMVVRTSSEDVVRAFWAKHSNRYDAKKAHIALKEERAISSGGTHFRRMLMYLTDYRERSDHGYCGVYIAVWFRPSGVIDRFYFSERMCPV